MSSRGACTTRCVKAVTSSSGAPRWSWAVGPGASPRRASSTGSFVAMPHHLPATASSSDFAERRPFDLARPCRSRSTPGGSAALPSRLPAGARGRAARGRRPRRDGGQLAKPRDLLALDAHDIGRPLRRAPGRVPRPLDLVTPAQQAIADGSSRRPGNLPLRHVRRPAPDHRGPDLPTLDEQQHVVGAGIIFDDVRAAWRGCVKLPPDPRGARDPRTRSCSPPTRSW